MEGENAADRIENNHRLTERPQTTLRSMLRLIFIFNRGRSSFSLTPLSTNPTLIFILLALLLLWKALPIGRYATNFRSISLSCCNLEQPEILIDGYIANTLLPQGAELYLSQFIKCLEHEPGAAIVPYASGWIVHRPPAPPTISTAYPHELATEKRATVQQRRELFDCRVNLDTGSIVPQPTQIKTCKLTELLSPIFFIMRNGFLGVPYKNLSASKFLYNATAHVPPLLKRTNLNARIRILVRQLSHSASVMSVGMNIRVFSSGRDIKHSTMNSGYLTRSLERMCPSLSHVSSSASPVVFIVFIW